MSQSLEDAVSVQGSAMSRIMKSSGSLLIKESHELADVSTLSGSDIKCNILILRNLLSISEEEDVTVGLILEIKEKYNSKTANIDLDEIDGLLASLELIEKEGMALATTPIAKPEFAYSNSIEIHFRTKDNMVLGVFENKGKLNYAIKLTTTADWAFMPETAILTLIDNLKQAKKVAEEL